MPPEPLQQALADLRHLYLQLVSGAVQDSAQAQRIAQGLLAPAIARLEAHLPPEQQPF